jgi:AcrR family transcriptional regulator/catechol 2,3-dioxygenase-like lactoylglutathione lyase family enzyme
MSSESRAGRPKASSRETLAEAACELFLERGYAATSVGDIAARAGVSRSSFFNYFSSKADILWSGLDERLSDAATRLEATDPEPPDAALAAALTGFAPDSLALAIVHAEAMGLDEELWREAAVRRTQIAHAVTRRLERGGAEPMRAEIAGAAYAAAVLAAVWSWAHEGAGRAPLEPSVRRALSIAAEAAPGRVAQLRVVVEADDLDAALAFYRDALGLVEQESYDGDDGARVAILGAGRATLELSNPAQVRFIDRVETDGVTSPHIRLAFEVADTEAETKRLEAAGATVLASARETPWRSVNARLDGPADLQLTLFHELGPAG